MRILVAGASGVLGIRIVPLLVAAGHEVAAMTRTAAKAEALRALGARSVVCDVYDAAALHEALVAFDPDVVIDELTDLPDGPRIHIDEAARRGARSPERLGAPARRVGADL